MIETEEHHGFGDAIRLIQLRVTWKLSKKTLCTTSNEPKTIVADENNASRVFV